jgi:hypothetical protein
MPRVKCYNVYKFEELTPEAQAKAIEKNRDINTNHNWWDSEYDHWKEELKNKGFTDPDIRFSGFWSQGDGASFTSGVNLKVYLKDKPKYRRVLLLDEMGHLSIKITRNHSNYVHEMTCSIDWDCSAPDRHTLIYGLLRELIADIEDDRRALCSDIYKALEADYNGLTSDESIKDTLTINDYEFNEQGEIE